MVGLTFDVAVPVALSLGAGAARIAAIRTGRIKLIQHESVTGHTPGGHAILKHIGKTQHELAARLKAQKIWLARQMPLVLSPI